MKGYVQVKSGPQSDTFTTSAVITTTNFSHCQPNKASVKYPATTATEPLSSSQNDQTKLVLSILRPLPQNR